MSKRSANNSRHTSLVSDHAHHGRLAEHLHKMSLFSTPLLGRRRLNTPSRRPGNDTVESTDQHCSQHGDLKRSFSLNAKARRNVALSRSRVNSSELHMSLCRLPNNSTAPVARYNVRSIFSYTRRMKHKYYSIFTSGMIKTFFLSFVIYLFSQK